MKRLSFLACPLLACLFLLLPVACSHHDDPTSEEEEDIEIPEIPPTEYEDIAWGEGERYVWDENYIPEIRIDVPLKEWNTLLKDYDRSSDTELYIHCDVEFRKGLETTLIKDAGLRLRGNTSRRRPEGEKGQDHQARPDWHKCHFGLSFRKFNKDSEHELMGIRKLHLIWFKEDPTHVRELFCYDLFRRAGIWTALQDIYCRVWVHVEGDAEPAYYGVYNMLETADGQYLKRRENNFGGSKGNLWKCVIGADFTKESVTRMGPDTEEYDYPYELKENKGTFDEAAAQLTDFITNVSSLDDQAFYEWINKVCDVNLLLRTYAVNVAMGGWDDHWNNSNNFYIYFNSNDPTDYQFFFIPYDYDNTLGTCNNCGAQNDAVKHDPFKWGNKGILIERLMKYESCRAVYKKELLRMINPELGFMDYKSATDRISRWHSRIKNYVSNDTGDGMAIEDKTASWSSHTEYRILDPNPNYNFFKVKAQVIRALK